MDIMQTVGAPITAASLTVAYNVIATIDYIQVEQDR